MNRLPLSGCVITLNEARNIEACLRSLQFADELVVVDSFSTDATVELARRLGARVVQRRWNGINEQRQFALEQTRHEWVLCLDADERISSELRAELEGWFRDPSGTRGEASLPDGFLIPRKAYHLGTWLRHGGWHPDRKLRLVRKSRGRFAGHDPHDRFVLDRGRLVNLRHPILHYTYRDLSHQLRTIQSFSSAEVRERLRKGERFRPLELLTRPAFKFLGTYFWKGGFRDGMAGWIISVVSSFYVFLKEAKLWECLREDRAEHL